jgi:Fur family iron response transcriptional regulator
VVQKKGVKAVVAKTSPLESKRFSLVAQSIAYSGSTAEERVRQAGLRPTRQRVALAELLFADGDRHISAEELHEEAQRADVRVSLATVYNTLHQFTEAGMLRILPVEGSKTYFDTNTSDHHHFFVEGENRLVDIDEGPVAVSNLPCPPEGMEISHVDIMVRLRPKKR